MRGNEFEGEEDEEEDTRSMSKKFSKEEGKSNEGVVSTNADE
jgi:hypothetical protein